MTDHAKAPLRPTKEETAERRARAWRLRHEYGLNTNDIADTMGCDRTTVSRMLSAVKRQVAATLRGGRFDPVAEIAAMCDHADRARRLSLQQYVLATEVRDKLRALRMALHADEQKRRILQECGLLPLALGEVRIEDQRSSATASEIRRLADEMRRLGALPAEDVHAIDLTPPGERAYLNGDVIDTDAVSPADDDDTNDERE